MEKSIQTEGEREGEEEKKQAEKTADVRFEAYIMQDQRILETDEDIDMFHDRLPDASSDSPYTARTPENAEGGIQGGGWKFQNPSRVKKKIKQIIRRELGRQDAISEDEEAKVRCLLVVITKPCNVCNNVLLNSNSLLVYFSIYCFFFSRPERPNDFDLSRDCLR